MKRRNGRVMEALERQETGCFIPSDALVTGRQTLKERDFRVKEGPADPENAEDWRSPVPRVLCLLQADQQVEFNAGPQPSVAPNGKDVNVKISRTGKFLNAELSVFNFPVARALVAVCSDEQYGGKWQYTSKTKTEVAAAADTHWLVQLHNRFNALS